MFTPFYHHIMRKYQIAFGSLFNNITLLRENGAGEEQERFVLPIEYSSQEAWLSRMHRDSDLDRRSEVTVPRLAYEMTSFRYDPSRHLNSLNQSYRQRLDTRVDSVRRYFAGAPYIMTLSLYALTRNMEDANQIVEQIVPYFTPDYTLMIKLIPSMGILDRMRIVMDGAPSWTDNYEETGLDSKRDILITFNFNAQVTFYGPISPFPPSIIRKIIIDLYGADYENSFANPVYYLTDSLDRLMLESGNGEGRLLDESVVASIRDIARVLEMTIVPDPIDAPPVKPVNTTTTITNFDDASVRNVFSGQSETVRG